MKMLFGFLSASVMAVSLISAAPNMSDCKCKNCNCTPETHCGCLSNLGCQCTSETCKCGDNCQCSFNCACGSHCRDLN